MTERVAVITGASSGIGLATASHLLSDGWTVHGWDLNPSDPDGITDRVVDVSDPASARAAAATLTSVDLLVNAAGISDRAPAKDMTVEQWQRVLDVDLSGVFWCTQALYEPLKTAGGVVINVASIASRNSFPGRVNYGVAKAGVVAMTEGLGLEWAADGIRVLAVSPGFVATEMVTQGIEMGWISEEAIEQRTPMARLASPDEIAAAIAALAGPAFSYVTGTNIFIDGGWNANGGF